MSTYRFLVHDIKQSHQEVFTDSKISSTQVLYWIIVVANRLRKDAGQKNDTGTYLSTFTAVPVLIDSNLQGRQYIELPDEIYDMPNEGAVKYITYNIETCCCAGPPFAQKFFQPTTAQKAYRLYYSQYENPSTTNPYFYRVGKRLYFLGTECIKLKDVEVQLFTSLDPITQCNVDEQIPLSDELIFTLRQQVINLAKYAYLFPTERKNIGDDITPGKGTEQAIVRQRPDQQAPQQPAE